MILLFSLAASAAPLLTDPNLHAELVIPSTGTPVPWGAAHDTRRGPDGALYITAGSAVYRYDEATATFSVFATFTNDVFQIDWTSDGTAWIADYYDGVFAYAPDGTQLGAYPTAQGLIGLVTTPDDRVFTNSHLDGSVWEIDRTTGVASEYALLPFNPIYTRDGCVRLYGMATDSDGAVMLTDLGCENYVYRMYGDADGRAVTDRFELIFRPTVPYGFYFHAYAPDGRSWYSTFPGEVWERSAAGVVSLFATQVPSGGGAGLFWDDLTQALYLTAQDGLWKIEGGPAPTPTATWSGSCPGAMTLNLTHFTPGGSVVLLTSGHTGSVAVPAGPCAGAVSGLGLPGIRIRATVTADANGGYTRTLSFPPAVCGTQHVQALDMATCTFSNLTTP